mmetsp:Transcript_74010/g.130600  ORF Transcript_74010/g.130600 Transcript_74010/m.130600 type:complete len:249 (-) Transcript_74010:249-995(-)
MSCRKCSFAAPDGASCGGSSTVCRLTHSSLPVVTWNVGMYGVLGKCRKAISSSRDRAICPRCTLWARSSPPVSPVRSCSCSSCRSGHALRSRHCGTPANAKPCRCSRRRVPGRMRVSARMLHSRRVVKWANRSVLTWALLVHRCRCCKAVAGAALGLAAKWEEPVWLHHSSSSHSPSSLHASVGARTVGLSGAAQCRSTCSTAPSHSPLRSTARAVGSGGAELPPGADDCRVGYSESSGDRSDTTHTC